MNRINVHPGDTFVIEPGTIHAIGKGITLLEIQESSNLTYRVYDFNRIDKNGNKRELHINKAIDILNFNKYLVQNLKDEKEVKTKYFSASKEINDSNKSLEIQNFSAITIIDGDGFIDDTEVYKYKTYLVLPSESLTLTGKFSYVLTSVAD